MSDSILLTTAAPGGSTLIPNAFLDTYLPAASGEFIKIYIYLLRMLQEGGHSLSIGSIADTFHITEGDVLRALNYWQGLGVLEMSADAGGVITSICLKPDTCSRISDEGTAADRPLPREKSALTSPAEEEDEQKAGQICLVIEQYLGHTLSPMDVEKIAYFHDDLALPYDVIDYLFEYCVSMDKKSMRYIERVALEWNSRHVTTVEQARFEATLHGSYCRTIMKELGLTRRSPAPVEMQFIRKWMQDYQFSIELVQEACRRTIRAIHDPSFAYIDRILTSWHKAGIHTLDQVKAADEVHTAKSPAKTQEAAARRQPRSGAASNRFHNFSQRRQDYSAIQEKLLRKQSQAAADPAPAGGEPRT